MHEECSTWIGNTAGVAWSFGYGWKIQNPLMNAIRNESVLYRSAVKCPYRVGVLLSTVLQDNNSKP